MWLYHMKDMKIDWKNRYVKVKSRKVAEVNEDGIITAFHEDNDVKVAVEEYMKVWREKRGMEE